MDTFTPTNKIQRLAYEKLGISSLKEFLRRIQKEAEGVNRVTARNWWLLDISPDTRFGNIMALADFLGISTDDLRPDRG